MPGVHGITIRAAEPEDAPAIFEIISGEKVQHGTLQLPYQSLSAWRERLATERPGFYRLVADLDGTAVGYAGLHVADSPRRRHVGEIGMMVRDDVQGKGVGAALLDALLNLADNWLGLRRIELDVYTDNAAGIHLYESRGFAIEGTRRGFAFCDGDYVDAYCMGRFCPARDDDSPRA